VSKKKRETIKRLALEALREHGGEWKPAAKQLVRAVTGRKDSTLSELAQIGALYMVRRLAEQDRRIIEAGKDSRIHMGTDHGSGDLPNIDTQMAIRYRGMWGYSLMGGVALGDATGEDLDAEIALRWRLSESNARVAQMLERIRAQVPDKAAVRDVLSPEEIEGLKKDLGEAA